MISRFRTYLDQVTSLHRQRLHPDVELLGQIYPDYYQIGRGYGNLLAFGVFDLNADGSSKLLRRGGSPAGATSVQAVDVNAIAEQAKYSWYNDGSSGLNPTQGTTPAQSGQGRRVLVAEGAALRRRAVRNWGRWPACGSTATTGTEFR